MIEKQIESTKQRLNLSTEQLVSFLNEKGLSYEDYFELTRQSTEYIYFNQKIIFPLVSINENEIIQFYVSRSKKASESATYSLIDFSVGQDDYKEFDSKKLRESMLKVAKSGIQQGGIETTEISDISLADLPQNIQNVLNKTAPQKLSNEPTLIGDRVHFFYVREKKLAQTDDFQKNKRTIKNILTQKKSANVYKNWFSKNKNQYFVKLSPKSLKNSRTNSKE